jgi:ankyrin repeat protein
VKLNHQSMSKAACAGCRTALRFNELLSSDCAALKRYINDGGNVSAREKTPPHRTLLHLACELRLTTTAQQLLEAGADVNAVVDDGITPLMSAQSADVARLLLNSGADPELRDVVGRSVLYLACANSNAELAKLLLKRCSTAILLQASSGGFSSLSQAIRQGNEGLALLVLAAHPADYDGTDVLRCSNVDTNLYTAAGFGFVTLAAALLKRGADVNLGCIGERDRTPYMYVAQEGHLAMFDLLHQYGATVNAVASDGNTALMTASFAGQALAIRRMFRHGVDVNIHTGISDRETPLYAAVLRGHIDTARVLLEAGAQSVCSTNCLIRDVLRRLDDDAAVPTLKLLLQHWHTDLNAVCDNSPDDDPLLMTAAMHRRLKPARYLVAAGANVNAKSVHGHTAVHVAAQYDAVRMLWWLIVTHKLDPCAASAGGWLPLQCACHMGCAAAAEYLLSLPQAAAMLTAQDDYDYTALHQAADSEHDDILQLQLRKGAAVDTECYAGATPLMLAHRMRTVSVLLNAHADVSAVDKRGLTVLHYCGDQGTA